MLSVWPCVNCQTGFAVQNSMDYCIF